MLIITKKVIIVDTFQTKWCFNTDVLKLALRDNNLEDEITSIILTKDGTIHEFHTYDLSV